MMPKTLLHCDLGDVVVLLDLLGGRYRLLCGAAADALRALLCEETSATQEKWLLERGFAVERQEVSWSFNPDVIPPTASIDECSTLPVSPLLTARAVIAQRLAAKALDRQPLRDVLVTLKDRAPRPEAGSAPSLTIAQAFRKSWRWVGQTDQCLSRSIALASMLFDRAEAARLVIGVRMPFAAHCWVQSGSLLLTEPLERIRPYTPILAV